MGTSVSHPSPSGVEWKEAKESIKEGAQPHNIVQNVLVAFGAEYGAEAQKVLVDAGVKKVAEILDAKLQGAVIRNEMLVATFINDARRELALSQSNSFFAELALSAASKAILQGGEAPSKSFAADFASKVIDYVVSRDLPSTIGSKGLTNLESVKRLLNSVSENFKARAEAGTDTNSIRILESLLAIPRRP
ncbi:MAG: hypothetical protein NDI63_10955 [Pseudobdellovibrio sp.]|nr:hypothetical protein [Pseudobdellovibrio sp.]